MATPGQTVRFIKLDEQGEIRCIDLRRSMFPNIEGFVDAIEFYQNSRLVLHP
jgi:hypothetical protein